MLSKGQKKIQSDKEKEISLLHLGAKKVLTHKPEDNKPKKNKYGSFLVNFKIPYIVTPVVKKKKPKAKKFQPKKVKKPHHIKKFHHRIVHHKKTLSPTISPRACSGCQQTSSSIAA